MSDNKGNYPFPPNAPPPAFDPNDSYIPNRPPPPSYDESQRSKFTSAAPTTAAPIPMYSNNSQYPLMNNSYYHVAQYNQPIVPRVPNNNYSSPPQYVGQHDGSVMNKAAPVVEFAAGARFNGRGSGSIVVPPPPPGCAPTRAQIAALQGRPVLLKKKKNPFF